MKWLFFWKFTHLRESLEYVGQHLQHRLPARVVLVVQLGHHKVQVLSQFLPQRVVQQVLKIDLQNRKHIHRLSTFPSVSVQQGGKKSYVPAPVGSGS